MSSEKSKKSNLPFIKFLICPICFVAVQCLLVAAPDKVISAVPAIWSVNAEAMGMDEVLPPHPKTRSATFELGFQAARFEICAEEGAKYPAGIAGKKLKLECERLALAAAGKALGQDQPLSQKQLELARNMLKELDEHRSVADRVSGFFSFVNIIWLVAIVGILATIGPLLYYILGDFLAKVTRAAIRYVMVPLHKIAVLEVLAYALAFLFSAQSLRYPTGQADAALYVGLTGGLGFVPCLLYSITVHELKGDGSNEEVFFSLCQMLTAGALVPLAIAHDSSLVGFLALAAVYGGLGFIFMCFAPGCFVFGYRSRKHLWAGLAASVFLIVSFTAMRVLNITVAWVRPFATGAMVLGNVMYFIALLTLSHQGWRRNVHKEALAAKATMVVSLVAALAVGNVYALPAMTNTATTFLVLFVMEMQFEVNFGSAGIVVIFVNFVALYFAAHYLHTHPQHIMSLFDPSGLYMS